MRSSFFALSLSLVIAQTGLAQNWTVGVPVDFVLADFPFQGSGCNPTADQTFNFPVSSVSGVQHAAIVTALSPPGTVAVVPGPSPLLLGDTIWLTAPMTRSIYFTTGSGSLTLEFHAIGTPTTVGQPHPCTFNAFWLSNLMLCPEGLSTSVTTPCNVQPGSVAVPEGGSFGSTLVFPAMENGWNLSTRDGAVLQLDVIDGQGRLMRSAIGSIDCAALPDGVYVIRASDVDCSRSALRFVLQH